MGAVGPRTRRLAGELADGVILTTNPDGVRDALGQSERCAEEGFSVVSFVDVRDNPSSGEVADVVKQCVDAGATTVALHSVEVARPPLADSACRMAEEVAPLLR